ncbi:hypothetical protein RRG08_002797 [Elysia crispata]|uniref:Uncharacterized protein n=1 Tax=Elysia crispata TaxID=231223 RepID=A0AAE1CM34_9GAST|nr:hypothetical protein RRG08_002797 [Elysia crispata]
MTTPVLPSCGCTHNTSLISFSNKSPNCPARGFLVLPVLTEVRHPMVSGGDIEEFLFLAVPPVAVLYHCLSVADSRSSRGGELCDRPVYTTPKHHSIHHQDINRYGYATSVYTTPKHHSIHHQDINRYGYATPVYTTPKHHSIHHQDINRYGYATPVYTTPKHHSIHHQDINRYGYATPVYTTPKHHSTQYKDINRYDF